VKNEVGEQIFPGGNTGIARFIVKAMIPVGDTRPEHIGGHVQRAGGFHQGLIVRVSRYGYGWVQR